MSTGNNHVIASLQGLIETCREREQGFRAAANSVEDEHLRILFNNYCLQRVQLAAELHKEIRKLGGAPAPPASTGALSNSWTDGSSADSALDDATILVECEQAEDAAIGQYDDILQLKLPPEVRQVLSRQYAAVRAARDRIRELEQSHAS